MKSKWIPGKLSGGIIALAGLILAVLSQPLTAGVTDLTNVPLANATTVNILPNIAMMIDDSGSMDEENMPDGGNTNDNNKCYKWYKYNTLAYNPAHTYKAPIKADGTRYANATFTAALKDGYFAVGQKMYDGSTTNATIDLTALGTVTTTKATIVFPDFGSTKLNITSLKVTLLDGSTIELLGSTAVPSTTSSNEDTVGQAVRDSINAHAQADGSETAGFSATYKTSGNILTITAPASQVGLTTKPTITPSKTKTFTISNFSDTTAPGFFYSTHKTDPSSSTCDDDADYNTIETTANIAAPGATNGSSAALTNYANWYSFYRKRAYLAKAGIGESFAALEEGKYRVGYFSIDSIESGAHGGSGTVNNDLKVDNFTGTTAGTHRATWFDRLYGTRKALYTPLRGALSRMGKMYAGKITGWDPVQYSCQRNYTILSTDGYWNDNWETATYGPDKKDDFTNVGDQDGVAGVTRPELDSSKAQNTLADVAYYYYHTDLRPGTCTAPDVCTDNVPPSGSNPSSPVDDVAQYQHMTTFTVGLGVNGTLAYQSGYKTSTSGDYYDITQGTKNWPNPVDGTNDNRDKIDDLWHAAVNGRGTYFSASDPDSLSSGISTALGNITSSLGSGAAAATSNLEPTTGDDAIYIATYRTMQWDGEMSAYTVNLSNGAISTTPTWQAAALLQDKIDASNSDTRTIYIKEGAVLQPFTYDNLSATEKTYFDNAFQNSPSGLNQYSAWSAAQKTAGTGTTLVNYLRGQDMYEDQDRDAAFLAAYPTYQRLYRDREKIIGDIVHSQPVYVKAPPYNFTDDGYSAFKTAKADRLPTLYAAANDGMLHAFDAADGKERWAYIPSVALPDLWRLADKDYSNNHRYFLDGPLVMADAKIGGVWKTILIGGMGAGGRGFYALDVTTPTAPAPLWNFTVANDDNVGYSYGIPFVTKLADGTWVAVVTSGYNNVSPGDGKGHVFVLNIADGSVLKDISTTAGDTTTPSGLAKLNVQMADFDIDNTAIGAYGGDLYGNMWRFDLDAGTASKLAAFGAAKPIMAAPEIADVDGKKVVYFGTGRYLGQGDLTNKDVQSIYAIKDDGTTTVSGVTDLVQQTTSDSGSVRSIATKNEVDWATKFGWYVNLPDNICEACTGGSERVTVDLQMYYGTLVVASTVPSASACQPGGYSWLYQLDYKTGGYVGTGTDHSVATKFTSPIVGLTVAKLPTGTPVIYPVTADGQKPNPTSMKLGPSGSSTGTKRILWRELIN